MSSDHPLLGTHKPSSQWYTPEYIWSNVYTTFNSKDVYDPCPIKGTRGLLKKWHGNKYIYVNPPTPAKQWALKALIEYKKALDSDVEFNLIFAAFSESVLWQVTTLQNFPTCWVRNRINWIDGNEFKKDKKSGEMIPNPGYMKESNAPRNYNAFCLLSNNKNIGNKFIDVFSELGEIRRSKRITKL